MNQIDLFTHSPANNTFPLRNWEAQYDAQFETFEVVHYLPTDPDAERTYLAKGKTYRTQAEAEAIAHGFNTATITEYYSWT